MSPSLRAKGEAQLREPVPEVGPQQVAERVDRHRRRQVHRDGRGRIGSGRRALRRRADVAAQDRALVAAGGEERVPGVGVDARHPEPGGVLRERDRVTSLRGQPPNLRGGLLGVEQREDPAGDEAVGMGAAPLVHVPVVVGPDHHEVDVPVGPEVQDLAGEAGPVREVQPCELAAGRHVAHTLVDVVATRTHVLVAGRVDVEHLRRLPRDRVEPEVPAPDVAVVPLLRPVGLVDDAGHLVAIPLGYVRVEHVSRLADVVVDRDQDEVVGAQCHDRDATQRARPGSAVGSGARAAARRRCSPWPCGPRRARRWARRSGR